MTTLQHEEFTEAQYGWIPRKRQFTGEMYEVLVGELTGGEQRVNDHGPYPSLTFELLEDQELTVFEFGENEDAQQQLLMKGNTVRWNAFGDIAKRELRDAGVKPGSKLKIAYLGKKGEVFTDPVIWRVRHIGGFNASMFDDSSAPTSEPEIPADMAGLEGFRSIAEQTRAEHKRPGGAQ